MERHSAPGVRAIVAGLVAGLGLLGTSAQAAEQALIDAATQEGEVVWYTTMLVDQVARPMVAAFEAKYPGIEVEYARSASSDVALKIINEGQAGQRIGDVFDGAGSYTGARAANMVAPYTPASAAELDDVAKDPDGYWHVANYYFLTAAINTDLLPVEDAPKTYDDLLDPQWKDQMVWSTVSEPTGAPGFVGNMLITRGTEDGMAYLDALASQNITNMSSSQRTVLDRVILGDFPIALMTFNHHTPISQDKGAQVEWLRMEPLVSSAGLVGLIDGAPHPNAGKLLIDFILSEEGQQIIADAGYLPSHPKVAALHPELQPNGPEPFTFTFLTPEIVAENLGDWVKIVDDLFK